MRQKYPERQEEVTWPEIEEVYEDLVEDMRAEKKIFPIRDAQEPERMDIDSNEPLEFNTLTVDERAARWRDESKARTSVTSEAIEVKVKRLRKSTGGGPQQISPWMIKQAVEGSANGSCH